MLELHKKKYLNTTTTTTTKTTTTTTTNNNKENSPVLLTCRYNLLKSGLSIRDGHFSFAYLSIWDQWSFQFCIPVDTTFQGALSIQDQRSLDHWNH